MELQKCSTVYGFAFVDCAALRFWVGSISDDASCAALGALLMQVSKCILYLMCTMWLPVHIFGLQELILNHHLVCFFQVSPKEVLYDSKGKLLVSPVVLLNRI